MAAAMRVTTLLAVTSLAAAVSFLSVPPKAATPAPQKEQPVKAPAAPANTSVEIAALRAKLTKVSAGLTNMLDAKSGSIAGTKVAASMRSFATELGKTLKETEGAKDASALKRLQDAQAGIHSLVKDMTLQQVRLMKESGEQQRSLLLGVLMTRRSDPMEKQLEVMKSPDFANLPEVKAVLAAKDTKTPLFQQIADYVDKHENHTSTNVSMNLIPNALKMKADGKPDVSPIVNALNARIQRLEEGEKHRAELHAKEMQALEASAKKEDKKNANLAHRVRLMKKSEDRKFKKAQALAHSDLVSLQAAVAAIQKGDIKALERSQLALKRPMQAMQAQSGRFLVLIELGHRMESLDCPYCAAQCVDKCHSEGQTYVTCLTRCADAGKAL
mmetsp:Transcript_102712/g.197157  ORF Transcript_102712/g.197157 Transcript_102712/m.197157 type:complete len:386 (+) Transcript_102712:105-1262(+)